MKLYRILAILLVLAIGHSHAMNDPSNGETSPSVVDLIRDNVQRSLSKENHIYGGSQALHGKYSYFVAGWACGGVLVWKVRWPSFAPVLSHTSQTKLTDYSYQDIVLTAAHCSGTFGYGAFVGAYSSTDDNDGAEFIPVDSEHIHPGFDNSTLKNDYMVLKLSRRSSYLPAKLNKDRSYPTPGTPLVTMGFGDYEQGSMPDILLETSLVAEDDQVCLGSYESGAIYLNSMMCTQADNVHSACYGDSGGPLVDEKDLVVGLVSFGEECASETMPNVFSRVSKVYCWTWRLICRLSRSPPRKMCKSVRKTCRAKKKKLRKQNRPPKDYRARQRDLLDGPLVDSDELFDLEGAFAGKDCEWLTINRWWQGEDLCTYSHIVYRCPLTCQGDWVD